MSRGESGHVFPVFTDECLACGLRRFLWKLPDGHEVKRWRRGEPGEGVVFERCPPCQPELKPPESSWVGKRKKRK